jgi:hypothetical protein
MQVARLRAVKENRSVNITFDIPGNTYRATVSSTGDFVSGATLSGVDMYATTFLGTTPTATFNYMGLATGSQGEVALRIQGKDLYRRVVLSAAGNARVQKSNNGSSWF